MDNEAKDIEGTAAVADPPRVGAIVYKQPDTAHQAVRSPVGTERAAWRRQLKAALGTTSSAFVDAALARLMSASTLPGTYNGTSTSISAALAFVQPMKPLLVETAPAGDGWIHEIKHDGFRTLLAIEPEEVRAFTSTGLDWTSRYRRVVAAAGKLDVGAALLDGEVVVQDERGVSDFEALGPAIDREPHRLVFFAFDLLHLDGEDLRGVPLDERRGLLRELLGLPDSASPIQFSEEIVGRGPDVFAAAERMGLEGIISKHASSQYRSGPSKAWAKTKCTTEGEFILVGSKLDGKIPTLLLARETEDGLTFAGSAFLSMPAGMRDELRVICEAIKIDRPAVEVRSRDAWWFRPELRVRVKHLRGEGGMLRHASAHAIVSSHTTR